MEKDIAKKLVQETLQGPFNKEQFIYLLKNILNRFDESKAFHARGYVKEKFRDTTPIIKTYERLGTYTDSEEKKIDLLIVYLQKENSIDRARTSLRNFVADYLKDRDMKDAALVAFVAPGGSDWRFSFVKMEYKFNELGKVKEEYTPAKRYSFLVGEHENSHTAQRRLFEILCKNDEQNPIFKDLEEVFNVERVTKEFFEKYRELFLRCKESLDEIIKNNHEIKADFEKKDINTVDFAKKLLGQIVFLYFLQKKGWFGVKRGKEWGAGSKYFLRELFEKKHGSYKNFFNDILEPLFYEALRSERSGDYYSRFNCRIPFLNGGLFDPINDYDWWNKDILLPDNLFSNTQKTKEEDIGDGILDIFDRYNFTVKEDEPLEKDVAVDPEMLGKVFENLLEVKDRKSKGTYYTPREIVHYMCEKSLIYYLETELNGKVDKNEIETLIKYGESVVEHDSYVINRGREVGRYTFKFPERVRRNAKIIDDKLSSIRICDPAVGSGAFLVGMMNEIVRTRNALTPYMSKNNERIPYNFKRQAIQNSLYGVDIDSGAVEIAKLRLWLSLVVDELEREKIQPLPNLDYKIMQGNSLIELLSSEYLQTSTDQKRNQLVQEFKKLKNELFGVTSLSLKKQKRKEIENLINRLFEHTRKKEIEELKQEISGIRAQSRLFEDKQTKKEDENKIQGIENKINEIKILKVPDVSEHFEWHINFSEIFQEKGGFDVVIANPPYVTTKYGKIPEHLKDYYVKNFESAYDKLDLYFLFIEKAIKISKEHGYTTFITPWNFLANFYSFKIRKFLLENTKIKLFNKLAPNVFGRVIVDNIISIFEKTKNTQGHVILFDDLLNRDNMQYIGQDIYSQNEKYIFTFPGDKIANEILNKTKKNSIDLGKIALNYIGIMTGGQNKMIANEPIFQNSKPVLGGKDIDRWIYFNRNNFVNFDKSKIHSNDNEKVYLSKKKILLRKTGRKLTACMDQNQFFTIQSLYNIVLKDKNYVEEYLLALLNSKLFTYLYNKFFITNPEVFPYIKRKNLDKMPIKIISQSQQTLFANLVNQILTITKSADYLQSLDKQVKVKQFEKQIDQMVYRLYGFTAEEVKIIEDVYE